MCLGIQSWDGVGIGRGVEAFFQTSDCLIMEFGLWEKLYFLGYQEKILSIMENNERACILLETSQLFKRRNIFPETFWVQIGNTNSMVNELHPVRFDFSFKLPFIISCIYVGYVCEGAQAHLCIYVWRP